MWVVIFALTAAIAWGWAFPLIKVGFSAFGITADMTGSKMLFAGIRFAVAGLIVLSLARSNGRSFKTGKASDWWFLLAFALMNTTLHYFFFYVGMSHSEGSRAAILNSLSTFLVVLLACACFKSDKLTSQKILGCAIGFSGILALNLGGAESGQFTWLGDGMIILNAICSARSLRWMAIRWSAYPSAMMVAVCTNFAVLSSKQPGMDDETQAGELYLDSLAVLPEYRCQGIARKLLLATKKRANRLGLPCVGLLVDKGNPVGEALYTSVGFQYLNDNQWGGHPMKQSFIQRTTGFGFGIFIMTMLPFLMPSYGEATTLSGLLAITTSAAIVWRLRSYVTWQRLWPILLTFIIVSTVAIFALTRIEDHILRRILGIALILISIYFMLFSKRIKLPTTKKVQVGAGTLSGLMGGFFGMQGPPAVLYFIQSEPTKEHYMAMAQTYFLIGNLMMTGVRAYNGFFTTTVAVDYLYGLGGVIIGTILGAYVFKHIPNRIFRYIVYAYICISGVIILMTN